MKKAFLILGIAAAALAVSCNKNELTNNETKVFEGDKAYFVVNINDVGGSETRGSDGGFSAGSADEHAIHDVHFYFYDSTGSLVTEANVVPSTWSEETEGTKINVEYYSNTVVVLRGLTQTKYPNYVVTVINAPDFTAPTTLDEFAAVLADENDEGIYNNSYFTISTSSYNGLSTAYYFATPVDDTNFTEEPITLDSDGETPINANIVPIKVYVERLAAKVTVSLGTLTNESLTVGTDTIYKLETADINENGEDETLYVRFEGWTLNATARHSYMIKGLDPNSNWDNNLTFTWNDTGNSRSYWGTSYAYGHGASTDYPSSSEGNTDAKEADETTGLNTYLKYTSLSGDLSDFGDDEYCAENTNTTSVITSKNSSALTSVLVHATLCDSVGVGVTVIRQGGVLYTPETYLDYVAEHIAAYTATTNGTATDYEQITSEYFTLTYGIDGYVTVAFTEDAQNETWYIKGTDGSYTPTDWNTVTGLLTSFETGIYGINANYYKDGDMYYSIPIEHLGSASNGTITEGQYGVVRNHWYKITIEGLEHIGRGIHDSDEVIIPIPDDDTWFLSAQINVLSWKLVNQSATL